MRQLIRLVVNGTHHDVVAESRQTLADVLRGPLGLTGTHVNCEQGICGNCTVLVDGLPTRSCLVFAGQADDITVVTVEGLAEEGTLSDVQQAFIDHHGLQCGFCTPGFLTLLSWMFDERDDPEDDEIREIVGSNLCRCTGYRGIMEAAVSVRDRRRGSGATCE